MDFLTKKEIEGLKQDIQSKEIAIEADKYMFEHKLADTYNGARASINECTKNNKIYRKKFKIVKKFTCND